MVEKLLGLLFISVGIIMVRFRRELARYGKKLAQSLFAEYPSERTGEILITVEGIIFTIAGILLVLGLIWGQ